MQNFCFYFLVITFTLLGLIAHAQRDEIIYKVPGCVQNEILTFIIAEKKENSKSNHYCILENKLDTIIATIMEYDKNDKSFVRQLIQRTNRFLEVNGIKIP